MTCLVHGHICHLPPNLPQGLLDTYVVPGWALRLPENPERTLRLEVRDAAARPALRSGSWPPAAGRLGRLRAPRASRSSAVKHG